ncbi:MAG: hypothetical protein KBC78_02310 [Candidatus Pacebacteria bacterium]|nr:hypothetical protein [Candidatus Paceibacterota bacterium]
MRSYPVYFLEILSISIKEIVFSIFLFLLLPIIAFGATLGLSPASGSYQQGSVLTVNVYADSNGTAFNALSGVVSYPKDLLEVVSVSKGQSIISLWVQEPSFSNTAGTVNFEGIVLNPGYNGSNGKVLTVTFKVKSVGVANLSFSSGSILANDGEGSEIISGKGTAQFTLIPVNVVEEVITDSPKVVQEEKENNNLIPSITSETHPKDSWSSKKDGVFNFTLTDDVTALRLLADDAPDSVPTNIYTPPITTKDIKDLPEGVSYLHVQYRNKQGWGEILHYKIQVDTQPPQNFIIKELGSGIFYFEAKDTLSDISNYEIQIDGGEVVKYTDDGTHIYKAPEIASGNHTLYVKAYDMAGNYTISTLPFIVAEKLNESQKNIETTPTNNPVLNKGAEMITVLSIVIPFLSLILLLILLLYLAWRSLWGLRKRLDKEVLEAKIIIHKAFALLRDDLEVDIETLKKANTKRKLTREESKILKRLQKNIEEAEKVIGKEVEDIERETQKTSKFKS